MNPHVMVYTDSSLSTAIRMSSVKKEVEKNNPNAKYTNDEIIKMKLYYHWGDMSYRELAVMFNTTYDKVYSIINKKSYSSVVLNFMTKIPESFHEETNNKYRGFKVKGHK